MTDAALKRRMDRAKEKARKDLSYKGFKIVHSNNRPVCLVAINRTEMGTDVRLIRICLEEIKPADRKALSDYSGLNREIWIRKEGSPGFVIHKF